MTMLSGKSILRIVSALTDSQDRINKSRTANAGKNEIGADFRDRAKRCGSDRMGGVGKGQQTEIGVSELCL